MRDPKKEASKEMMMLMMMIEAIREMTNCGSKNGKFSECVMDKQAPSTE